MTLFAQIPGMDEYLRSRDEAIAIIAASLKNNVYNLGNLSQHITYTEEAIQKIERIIDKQVNSAGIITDPLNKWIAASFKGSEMTRSKVDAILVSQSELGKNIERLSATVGEMTTAFEQQMKFNKECKTILEYLLSMVLDDTANSKKVDGKKDTKNLKYTDVVS